MSLIKCPECGKTISEYAQYCINCGCPMEKIKDLSKSKKKVKKVKTKSIKPKKEEKVKEVKQDKVVHSSFLLSRDETEQKFISDVVKCVQNSIENAIGKDHPNMFSIRILNKENNYETIGWFRANDKNKLIFRYYKNLHTKEVIDEFIARTKIPEDVAGILIKIFRKQSNNSEEDNVSNLASEQFYCALVSSIQGRKKIKCSSKQKYLIQEITKFVLDDVCANAIADKVFKDKKDFEKYKKNYHYMPTFFGSAFSFRNITKRVANNFISYFISAQIIAKIKEYEKLYNEEIITSYEKLIKDYSTMYLKNRIIIYSNSSGIKSSISYVPSSTLDSILHNLIAYF